MQITPSEDTLAQESSSLTQTAWGRSKTLKSYRLNTNITEVPQPEGCRAQAGLAVEESLMNESIQTRNPNTSLDRYPKTWDIELAGLTLHVESVQFVAILPF